MKKLVFGLLFFVACQTAQQPIVRMTMWQGDPQINRYMNDWVVPEVKKRFGIRLEIAPGQGNELVKMLLAEKEAGKAQSATDIVWINGETFFQLRQIGALDGPFVQQLPNAALLDLESPFIGTDFQQKTDGFECPWGNVQLALIYDTIRTPQPPRSLAAFEEYVKNHPQKVTIPYEFTGMTLLKSWLWAFAKQEGETLDGPFDEAKYQRFSAHLFDYVRRLKPHLWRRGETFPESLAAMHQLFANGELDFTMSNNDNEVDNKISQRVLPPTAKSFVFESGTIQNSHYLGIPKGAPNAAGAREVINFLISPEAQLKKLNPQVWGDGTVLDLRKLKPAERAAFENLPERKNAARRADIQPFALPEPAPEYMIRLFEDFRKHIIEQK